MKKFKNHQRPRREYRFDILDHKKTLKIWRDSTFNLTRSLECCGGYNNLLLNTAQSLTLTCQQRIYVLFYFNIATFETRFGFRPVLSSRVFDVWFHAYVC